jgi:putative CocE/NonD family hydrolase
MSIVSLHHAITIVLWFLKLNDAKYSDVEAFDRFIVDFTIGSGQATRWTGLCNPFKLQIGYKDRKSIDQHLIYYTSSTLDSKLEVTGHVTVTLFVTVSHPDVTIFLYVSDVDQNDHVQYVTEGQLRLVHRRISGKTKYGTPWRSFEAKDGSLMEADPLHKQIPQKIEMELLPISYVFKPGHKIRLSIAGADADQFTKIPSTLREERVSFQVYRGRDYKTFVELPVAEK